MEEFTIIPILGRRTDVAQDDDGLFRMVGESVALTHDVGGYGFDLQRKRGACSKMQGIAEWSKDAIASSAKCLSLFELFDGANRNYIFFDNGNCYVYESDLDPAEVADAGATTFAQDNIDLYSVIRVGAYMVFSDRGEHTPYKWKHGDANLTKLASSGTEYKFRYLTSFARRVVGLYSDQTDGNIDVRYSTAWPSTAITSLNFPAANQLYIPNDDPIVGCANMGTDSCFIYCDDSIQQLIYFADYESPFKIFTVVANNVGTGGHHSIVHANGRHYMYSNNYGFCEYRGGGQFPYKVISDPIEQDISGISKDYSNLMVGTYFPRVRKLVWTVPLGASATPNAMLFYSLDTEQWEIVHKSMRYVDVWKLRSNKTWNDLIVDFGTGAIWSDLGNAQLASYAAINDQLVFANTDGEVYYLSGETDDGNDWEGYRIEPILSFGNPKRRDLLKEVWFGITEAGAYSIDIYYRQGETVAEVLNEAWVSAGSISTDDPSLPKINIHAPKMSRYYQIKWGTDLKNEKFEVNKITFRYEAGSEY